MNGNVTVVVGGDAETGASVYGGSENGNCTIAGNVAVTIDENAQIATGNTAAEGVFLGGQQPGDTIQGTAIVNILGGVVHQKVSASQFNTTFAKEVTLNVNGGTVQGGMFGLVGKNTSAPSITTNVLAGKVENGISGMYQGTAQEVAVHILGGTVEGNVIAGGSNLTSWEKGVLSIEGGTLKDGKTVLRQSGDVALPASFALNIKGNPTFTNADIMLREGEYITQTGAIDAGRKIAVDVSNIDAEGVLVVKPLDDTITLNEAQYALTGTAFSLVPGSTAATKSNLYLGQPGSGDQEDTSGGNTDSSDSGNDGTLILPGDGPLVVIDPTENGRENAQNPATGSVNQLGASTLVLAVSAAALALSLRRKK